MYKFGLNVDNPVSKETEGRNNPFLPVRVIHIILDSSDPEWEKLGGWDSLGTIKFVPIYSEVKDNQDSINYAKPLFSNLKHYPLKTEITWVIQLPAPNTSDNSNFSTFYYLNIVNLWNHPHHNALPPINFNTLPDNLKLDYREIETGLVKKQVDENGSFKLGNTFVEKSNIKPVLPFEGDIIHEGRWGQSIRFGSTVKGKNPWSSIGDNGDPILIIRNGQSINAPDNDKGWIPTLEDINGDGTSIYFTDGQAIPIVVASKNQRSFKKIISEVEFPKLVIPDNPPPISQSQLIISNDINISSSLDSSAVAPSNPVVLDKVYNEEEIQFSFPGEDTKEFIFDVENIDEEIVLAEEVPEKYEASILGNESSQTKDIKGNYAVYKNGQAEYLPVVWIGKIRVVKKYSPFVKLILDAAISEGVNIRLNSGFRTWDEQVVFRKKNIKDKTKIRDEDFLLNASSREFKPQTGKPGYSNHQSGTAFDFNTRDMNVFKWLIKNASTYGFVRTVKTERWHWEYIPNTDMFTYVPKDDKSWEGLV